MEVAPFRPGDLVTFPTASTLWWSVVRFSRYWGQYEIRHTDRFSATTTKWVYPGELKLVTPAVDVNPVRLHPAPPEPPPDGPAFRV